MYGDGPVRAEWMDGGTRPISVGYDCQVQRRAVYTGMCAGRVVTAIWVTAAGAHTKARVRTRPFARNVRLLRGADEEWTTDGWRVYPSPARARVELDLRDSL